MIKTTFGRGSIRSLTGMKQEGAVLFVALMFLIILTLIGLSAANVGVLQERMAGNVRDSNVSFQLAEATLRSTEQRIRQITEVGGTGGLGTIPIWSDVQGALGINRQDCTMSGADTGTWPWRPSPDIAEGEYFVVELNGASAGGGIFGSACRPMQSQSAGNPGEAAVYYLLGARAPGPTGVAETVVQTIYFWP